jgi:ferredoxin
MTTNSSDSKAMRISIDEDLCRGHGHCYNKEPGVFSSDDEGFAVVDNPLVRGADIEAAERAASDCPEHAISVMPAD